MTRSEEPEHESLIKEFKNSGILKGKFEEGVKVGRGVDISGKIYGQYEIDLVCKTPQGEVWVIEVEPKLNPTALGQVMVYKELYLKEKSIFDCKNSYSM